MDIINNNHGLKRKIPSNQVESQNKSQKIVKSGKTNAQKHQQQFRYGNYANYYQKRYGQSSDVDIRITMLQPHHESFTDKKVLDIGCNSGDFSFELARSFRIKSLLGVDIDGGLIEKARTTLQRLKTENDESIISDVLNNVTFRKANYILNDPRLLDHETPQFDVIMCLSVTKWIHLNYGDDGIKFMFKRIFKQLNKDGILVLEAQAFDTYKKRSKICPEMLENYRNIKFRPEHFEAFLLSEEVGFTRCWCISDEGTLRENIPVRGFRRNLQMFVKR